MTKTLLFCLLALTLVACSTDAPEAPGAAKPFEPDTSETATDATARIRLGMVFGDSDPWMAGAVLEHGRIRVGDRLYLLDRENQRIPVRITAIRDDASQSDVTEAGAPHGIFLSFRPEPFAAANLPPDCVLVGDPALRDYASSTRSAMSR
ncbi:MAG: hypothetical protein IT478_13780 [Xanthomonadales bacterium]|jgi:hypothetical protein|nr:hypothetical protein [Xanthomonadales bacterium]